VGLVLSYSRKDSQFADLLQSILLSRGYDVWIDRRNIEVGTRWDDSIQTAIDVRNHLAVILSPTSVASQNVADEWSYAIEQGKIVVPVYYQECTVPMRLRRLQRVDFYNRDFAEKLGELQAALGAPDGRTKLRKNPFLVHIIPAFPTLLNMTGPYCPKCDLLILHQDKVERMLMAACELNGHPELIGNEYLVVGIVERSYFREASAGQLPAGTLFD